jgi:hypothetical protein
MRQWTMLAAISVFQLFVSDRCYCNPRLQRVILPFSSYHSSSYTVVISDWDDFLGTAVTNAQNAGKKLIVEEWGSEFSSNDGSRVANLQNNVQKMNEHGVSWIYWELITNPGMCSTRFKAWLFLTWA